MLILLPPSEGKTAPTSGDPVELGDLAFAEELGGLRAELLDALERLAAGPREEAVRALALSPGQVGEVEIDSRLRGAPAVPAAEVYSGVLYDRLGLAELPAAARRRADRSLLIASALWGFLRPGDRIPYYRFSAKARLDGIGPPAKWWRSAVATALPDEPGELIVDLRSAAYAAAWIPERATTLAVGAFRVSGAGRKPVTHMAKAIRGEVARVLLEAGPAPADPAAAAELVEAAGHAVELAEGRLDVIVR